MILISQEIPPFSLFLFPFWEIFSVSFYTPTTMKTGPAASIGVTQFDSRTVPGRTIFICKRI